MINFFLKLKNIDKSDNGMYKCSVNGFEGEYSKSIVIDGRIYNLVINMLNSSH